MAKATELTYENMKEFLENYFGSLKSFDGPRAEDQIREFFTPDAELILRFNPDAAVVIDREQWVKTLCLYTDYLRASVSSDAPHEGMIIDVKNGKAAFLFEEFLKHPVTGEPIKPPTRFGFKPREYRISVWELRIHDNKVKGKSELIIQPRYEPFQRLRKAVSLSGDCDTLACLAGGIAQAYYKHIPNYSTEKVKELLDEDLLAVVDEFNERYGL